MPWNGKTTRRDRKRRNRRSRETAIMFVGRFGWTYVGPPIRGVEKIKRRLAK